MYFSFWFIGIVYIFMILLLQVGALFFYFLWVFFDDRNLYFKASAFCILFNKLLSIWSYERYLAIHLSFNFCIYVHNSSGIGFWYFMWGRVSFYLFPTWITLFWTSIFPYLSDMPPLLYMCSMRVFVFPELYWSLCLSLCQ